MPFSLSLPHSPLDAQKEAFLRLFSSSPVVLVKAPTGSGKSTRIPLWLLEEEAFSGCLLLLEPRRVVARALAMYLAGLLGEKLGGRIGIAMRGTTVRGNNCRILVVTEGVFTRMLVQDEALPGIGAVLFDEFHERSLASDLGLALADLVRSTLREDLKLVILSATLEPKDFAALPDVAFFEAECRSYPVDLSWCPPPPGIALQSFDFYRHIARVVSHCIRETNGTILVFLPGAREQNLVLEALGDLPDDVDCHLLSRHTPVHEQDIILNNLQAKRVRIVLATSLAESALTIDNVSVVVDSGLARFQRFDPRTGIERLVTERASLAAITQRSGRAGRLRPGVAIRLWAREEEKGFAKQHVPEIERADISSLLLALAHFGLTTYEEASALFWLSPLPQKAFATTRAMLIALDALSADGALTKLGREMTQLPLAARLARLVLLGKEKGILATAIALAVSMDQALHTPPPDPDCAHLVADFLEDNCPKEAQKLALRLAQTYHLSAQELFKQARQGERKIGLLLLGAWPYSLASQARVSADTAIYQLRSGHAVALPASSPLTQSRFLVAPLIVGRPPTERIRLAAKLSEEDVLDLLGKHCLQQREIAVTDGNVQAYLTFSLNHLVLKKTPVTPSPEENTKALLALLTKEGLAGLARLPWSKKAKNWQARLVFLRTLEGEKWPDVSDAALLARPEWLYPLLEKGSLTFAEEALYSALQTLLPYHLRRALEEKAPASWQAPSGLTHPICYGPEGPSVALKLQECFGLSEDPRLCDGRIPLRLTLLSPAGRPLQTTTDLASFWQNGYKEVRREMLGRYPKHPWPEDPLRFTPTAKTKKALAKPTKS